MDLFGISWLWWLLGTLGIGGTVALAVFAPAVIPLVVQAVVRALAYLVSTRWGCALLAAVVAFAVADIHRSISKEAEFRARTEAFEQAQTDRDNRIAALERQKVDLELEIAAKENAKIDAEVKEFRDALPPVPHTTDNPFRVGADSCRLRRIAGQAERGCGEGAGRVPTPRRRPAAGGNHR